MFLFQYKEEPIAPKINLNTKKVVFEKNLTVGEVKREAFKKLDSANENKDITKEQYKAYSERVRTSKTSEQVLKVLGDLKNENSNFTKYYKEFQDWYATTYLKQQMTDKAKEAQSFVLGVDPNLTYAQGAGLSKQQEERRSGDLEIAEGFWVAKENKGKKKAA